MNRTCLVLSWAVLTGVVAATSGCSSAPTAKAPDVAEGIRQSLKASGLKDVNVSQDREKGLVTLTGHVAMNDDKARAETIAKSMASGQAVADEIAVLPPGAESEAKAVNSDLDKAIEKNLDAAFIENGMNKEVKYDVKVGVVTLTGNVNSQARRAEVAHVARSVPNVQQVVNELQVTNQRATSSN